jgi:ectoine hydroxylase-related dioxygenase (phytanoyl-CoA dioxygenase family)
VTDGDLVLDAAQLAAFEAEGFLALARLTTEAEVESLRALYDRLFDETELDPADRVELAGARLLPQVLNPDRYAPELRETLAYRNAAAVARQLLGDDVEHMGMHAIRKPARSGAETPWHQDEAYWDPAYRHRALSVWLPLQPATLDNGCLWFLPGSHREEVREHVLAEPGAAEALRLKDPASFPDAVACPVPAGGATVHAARTLHHAGPNLTDEPRRALVMAFRVPPVWEGTRSFPWRAAAGNG